MRIEDIWFGKSKGARFARTCLLPLSGLYALGWQGYLAVYKLGLKKSEEPHFPTICIGNLVVGGSGKSPVTLFMAEALKELGEAVVIGCSGYGGRHAENACMAPDGPLDPKEWGDEPAMIRWLAPEFPLVVGRNRVEAARLVAVHAPESVLLMDDGFQHMPLQKHFTIILDEENPENRWTLPAGPYREARNNRKRADMVLPGCGFEIHRGPLLFQDEKGVPLELDPKVQTLCAIGRPDQFIQAIEKVAKVEKSLVFADHRDLQAGNLLEGLDPELPVVVTAKDWVKIRLRPDIQNFQWRIALLPTTIEPKAKFLENLSKILQHLRAKKTPLGSGPKPSSPKP